MNLRVLALAGTAAAAVAVGTALHLPTSAASPSAVASHTVASSPTWQQMSASCVQTSDGRGCVGLQSLCVTTPGPALVAYVTCRYRGVMTLTPAPGHVLRPVAVQPINPGFTAAAVPLCSEACPTGHTHTYVLGSMSRPSVLEFTYNSPGATHHVMTGYGRADTGGAYAHTTVLLDTEYRAGGTRIVATVRANLSTPASGAPRTPAYVRIFDGRNRTLAAGAMCPMLQRNACEAPGELYARRVLVSGDHPYGAAARLVYGNATHVVVAHSGS